MNTKTETILALDSHEFIHKIARACIRFSIFIEHHMYIIYSNRDSSIFEEGNKNTFSFLVYFFVLQDDYFY